MSKQPQSVIVSTDLGIAEELQNKEFRNQFFRTEREIDIPSQIKTLRKLRGLTQEELAIQAGTKQSAISRLERSQEANWELETLVKLAEAMGARLAVVIEPYEVVAARYKSDANTNRPSATTADRDVNFQVPRPRLAADANGHEDGQPKRKNMITEDSGAPWN